MNTALNPLRNKGRAFAVCAATAAILLVAGCGGCGGDGDGSKGPGDAALNLVIGDAIPLSGSLAGLGPSAKKASDLAAEKIDDAIEETDSDNSVRVIHADEGQDESAATDATHKLIKNDGANCLTGPWASASAIEVAESVATPNGVLEILPSVTHSQITDLDDNDLVDRTALPAELEGGAVAKAIRRELGGAEDHTVNVVATNQSYSNSLTEAFIEAWQGEGGTVGSQVLISAASGSSPGISGSTTSTSSTTTSTSDSSGSGYPSGSSGYSSDSSSYSSEASQINTGSPDAILVIADPTTFSGLGPALVSSGADPTTIWGSDQLVLPGLADQLGTDVVNGMHVVAPGSPTDEDATSAFDDLFKSSDPPKVKPAPFAAQQFDATLLCYLAAVAAGSTDGQMMADKLVDITAPGGEEFTWRELPDAVNAIEDGDDIDFTGASGPIDLDVNGDPTSGTFTVYVYDDGRLKPGGDISVEKPSQTATP